jgi:hypothetical protein
MTLPYEKDMAIANARKVLWAILVGDKEMLSFYSQHEVKTIPKWLKATARYVLKHYPSEWEITEIKPFSKESK